MKITEDIRAMAQQDQLVQLDADNAS